MTRNVAIIGGGFAGMAAAVTLTHQGVPVTLFEAGRQLGGRARSVPLNDLTLDNGQHILIGAYRKTLELIDFLQPKESRPYLRLPLVLEVPDQFKLQAARLPAPWHLLSAILRAEGISWRDRLSLAVFFSSLKRQRFKLQQDEPLLDFLQRHKQSRFLLQWLWEPLCLAALNTPPGIASAQLFINVLRDSLMGAAADSDMVLPTRSLGELFPQPAGHWISQHGGTVHTGCRVHSIQQETSGFTVHSPLGMHSFSHVICATAPQHTASLLPDTPLLDDVRHMLSRIDYQPIYTVYLQYAAGTHLHSPLCALPPGRMVQWLFDRGQLTGEDGLFAAVVSAHGSHVELTHDEIATLADEEIRASLKPALPAPLWYQVIAEKRATFAAVPHLDRPPQNTRLNNFYLAGDYTAGDYPATLEGAVRSGLQCAALVMQ